DAGGNETWGYTNRQTIPINPVLPGADPEMRYIWRSQDPVRNHSADPTIRYPSEFTVDSMMAGMVLFPVKWMGLFANYSEGFTAINKANDINRNPVKPPTNTGIDVGLKFELFSGKISGRVGYYKSRQSGYNGNFANGLASNFAISNQPDDAMWDLAQTIYSAAYTATNDPQYLDKLRRAEELDGAMQSYVDTIDIDANGWELDFTLNLTKSWRAMLNAAITDNAQNNAMPATKAYWNEHLPEWESLIDLEHYAGFNGTKVRGKLDYIDMVLAGKRDGRPLNGTPDYTANFFTTYTFLRGPLKGLKIGGGAQFIGPRILGFKRSVVGYIPSTKPDEAANPQGTLVWEDDPLTGYKAKAYMMANAMCEYNFKLWGRPIRAQLHISNLLGYDRLIYAGYVSNSSASQLYEYLYAYLDEDGVPRKGKTGAQVLYGFRYPTPRRITLTLSTNF
ncbi:MAG: TonB-dependent receptor, partial [Opitutaceae bacterium]|nr:TonB-dependent receptor [Opitutaceae bacterium]